MNAIIAVFLVVDCFLLLLVYYDEKARKMVEEDKDFENLNIKNEGENKE